MKQPAMLDDTVIFYIANTHIFPALYMHASCLSRPIYAADWAQA